MSNAAIEILECDNPDCLLRFPVYQGAIKPRRCPSCRSSLHVVLTAIPQGENGRTLGFGLKWKLEVLLDNIRSAWNVGAIFRTSDGLGIQKIYCCGITPTPDQSKVAKTALGAEESISWEYATNGVRLAASLKSRGYTLWALEDIPVALPLYSIDKVPNDQPVVIVVGNENCGVDPAILELCDQVISIPMVGRKQSYNVAVAFGIAASFLIYRQNDSQGSLRIFPNT